MRPRLRSLVDIKTAAGSAFNSVECCSTIHQLDGIVDNSRQSKVPTLATQTMSVKPHRYYKNRLFDLQKYDFDLLFF